MGEPLPEPIYGNNCLVCFPPGATPETIVVFISGVEWCPFEPTFGPQNGAFLCDQVGPCSWSKIAGTLGVNVIRDYLGGWTYCDQNNTGRRTFVSVTPGSCNSGGPNDQICTAPFWTGFDGAYFADFSPWPTTPRKLCDTYNLLPSEDTFTDPYIINTEPPTTVVFTLANIKYSTKLRIKYDYTV